MTSAEIVDHPAARRRQQAKTDRDAPLCPPATSAADEPENGAVDELTIIEGEGGCFSWALLKLKVGCKMRRQNWHPDRHIAIKEAPTAAVKTQIGESSWAGMRPSPWWATADDLLSQDWEPVE